MDIESIHSLMGDDIAEVLVIPTNQATGTICYWKNSLFVYTSGEFRYFCKKNRK